MDCAVAYYRVSTRQQQRSGLGIEAQRAAVERFAETEKLKIVAEYVEAETGKARMRSTDARNLGRRWPPPKPPSAASWSRNSTGCRATLRSSPA